MEENAENTPRVEIPRELVAERAFALWHARGRPIGDPWTDWSAAERELVEESAAALVHPPVMEKPEA